MTRQSAKASSFDTLPQVNLNAAGLDIGSDEIWACVPPDRDPQPVRQFGTFTPDLQALAAWLAACQIDTVAMESTGVYWIPVFEMLEAHGLNPQVVNARHLKHVPGRKSDWQDCQWIQRLHSFGLLSGSFRPEADICALRAYLRHRATLLEHRAAHIQHRQKALQQMSMMAHPCQRPRQGACRRAGTLCLQCVTVQAWCRAAISPCCRLRSRLQADVPNVQLTLVLSDITGETGLAILRAILAGERDPVVLARLRDPRCKSHEDEMAKALSGNYRAEPVFALKQALTLYDAYTEQLRECDAEIEKQFQAIQPVTEDDPPPSDKPSKQSQNGPSYDARTLLFHMTGVDWCAISGLNESTVQTIIAEIGTDLSQFSSEKWHIPRLWQHPCHLGTPAASAGVPSGDISVRGWVWRRTMISRVGRYCAAAP